jgi:hypothetical protein
MAHNVLEYYYYCCGLEDLCCGLKYLYLQTLVMYYTKNDT